MKIFPSTYIIHPLLKHICKCQLCQPADCAVGRTCDNTKMSQQKKKCIPKNGVNNKKIATTQNNATSKNYENNQIEATKQNNETT